MHLGPTSPSLSSLRLGFAWAPTTTICPCNAKGGIGRYVRGVSRHASRRPGDHWRGWLHALGAAPAHLARPRLFVSTSAAIRLKSVQVLSLSRASETCGVACIRNPPKHAISTRNAMPKLAEHPNITLDIQNFVGSHIGSYHTISFEIIGITVDIPL